jgi:RNA polymerase sigma-70 factor (ECF subfamily)
MTELQGRRMTSEPVSDADLLARHVEGDTAAFGELVARHRDRLWAVALRTLGDREDAADAVQDALLSAYRGAASFRGGAAVTTWLHRIVVNACIDLVRRRTARPVTALPDDIADRATGRDPVADRETSLAVTAALRTLPVEQSTALVLIDIEGFSVAEAAEILDVAIGTVKSRCARGRARLAPLLHHLGSDADGNEPGSPTVQPGDRTDEEPA